MQFDCNSNNLFIYNLVINFQLSVSRRYYNRY